MYNYPTIGTGVCFRVSSVFVASNDLNYQMEVGWLASPEDNVCGAMTDAARLLTAVTDPGIPAGSGNPNNPAGFWCPGPPSLGRVRMYT